MARGNVAFGRMKAAYGRRAATERSMGELKPKLASIQRRIEEDEERRRGRNLLLSELSALNTDLKQRRERTKEFRTGAKEAGVELGEMSLLDRIGITGPDVEQEYLTDRGMATGEQLLNIGRGFGTGRGLGMRLLELLGPEYDTLKPDTSVMTPYEIRKNRGY